eukprot:gene7349-470_t
MLREAEVYPNESCVSATRKRPAVHSISAMRKGPADHSFSATSKGPADHSFSAPRKQPADHSFSATREEYGIPPPPAYGSVHEHDTATYDHGSGQFTNSRQGSPINSRNGGAAMELNSWKAPRASPQPMLHDMDISAAMQAPPGLSKYPTVSGDVLPMGGGISTSMMSAAGGGASMMGAELRIQVVVGTPIKLTGPSQLPGVVEYYMSYPVTIITTLPSYSAPESTVRRRFRDFVALQELIHILYPGFIIPSRSHPVPRLYHPPPRPKRNAVEGRRMLPSFIEDRRASLERYLTRLGRHPVLGRCQALQLFLEYNGDLRHNSDWLRLHPANKGFISGTAKLFRQMVGKERRGVMKHAPVSVHEKQLREEAVGVEEVRLRLSHMSRCCEDLVIRISDRNHALGDLATSIMEEEEQCIHALGDLATAVMGKERVGDDQEEEEEEECNHALEDRATAVMYMSKYEETRGNNLYYTEQAVSETCGQ